MMLKRLLLNAILGIALILGGCKDFFETSIASGKVLLYSPADSIQTNVYQQSFWWERMDDALRYRIQIASPNFSKPVQLLLDTLIKGDKFVFSLDPGTYEWRVRGENGSSHSPFSTRYLTVHPSALSNQIVQIMSPVSQTQTSNTEIKYQWGSLYGALQYRLQVDRNQFADEQKLVLDIVTDQLSYVATLPQEGNYQFRVRAENQTEISKWSSTRILVVDQTPPEKIALIAPTNQQSVAKPVQLSWRSAADADKYEVYVFKSDKTTIYNANFPQLTTSTALTINFGDSGENLYWKVRAIDKAGNKGEFSELYLFSLQ